MTPTMRKIAALMGEPRVVINYAKWDPANIGVNVTLSGGNLIANMNGGAATTYVLTGTNENHGKYYWEIVPGGTNAPNAEVGVADSTFHGSPGQPDHSANAWIYYGATGDIYAAATIIATGPTFGAGDVISVAFDITGGKLWWANNGTWILGGNPATGANPVVTGLSGTFFGVGGQGSGGAATQTANFGLGSFVYTVPLGFTAGFT